MGVKAFDFDGDGRLDIFVTSMHPDMWVNVAPGNWAAENHKADSATVAPGMIPGGKSIEVAWPSGRRQTVAGPIKSGQVVEIDEK